MQRSIEYTIPYEPKAGRQREFHGDRRAVKYRLISAGTGGGKTVAGVFEDLSWLLENPGIVGYIFEPTYPMVRRILIPTLEKLLGRPFAANPAVKMYHQGDNRLELVNSSQLWFGSLEDPEASEGPNVDFVHVDEARLVRHFDVAWQVIQRRLRGSIPGRYPTGAWITTTPDAPGSDIWQFFESPENAALLDRRVYRWSIFDNPCLPADYVAQIVRSHRGGLAERFVHGRFAQVGAGTVPFDYTVHVVSEVVKAAMVEVVYGVDFGWDDPSVILAVGFDRDGGAWVFDEFYQPRVTQSVVLVELRNLKTEYGGQRVFCDPTAKQTVEWLKQNGLQAQPNEPKRDEGIREMAGRFTVDKDGHTRIHVHKRCVNLIAELQVYDETVEGRDHAVDALRYAVGSRMKKKGPVSAWRFG